MLQRKPLFERPPKPLPLALSREDDAVLRHVRRHRFLTARQIARATAEDLRRAVRRAETLFLHGYLERPRSQLFDREFPFEPDVVHGLAKRGVRRLRELGEVRSHRIHEKRAGRQYLDHTVGVAEFMTRLEVELPQGVSLRYEDDLSGTLRSVSGCSWSVPIRYRGEGMEAGVVPDRVFRLETRDESLVFCLEVDRGTMPIVRSNPAQSSYYRKMLAYHETWRSGMHLGRLGWRRFRVLTLTSSPERKAHMVEVCRELTVSGGSGLFMFADLSDLSSCESLAAMPWATGDGYNLAKLISETGG